MSHVAASYSAMPNSSIGGGAAKPITIEQSPIQQSPMHPAINGGGGGAAIQGAHGGVNAMQGANAAPGAALPTSLPPALPSELPPALPGGAVPTTGTPVTGGGDVAPAGTGLDAIIPLLNQLTEALTALMNSLQALAQGQAGAAGIAAGADGGVDATGGGDSSAGCGCSHGDAAGAAELVQSDDSGVVEVTGDAPQDHPAVEGAAGAPSAPSSDTTSSGDSDSSSYASDGESGGSDGGAVTVTDSGSSSGSSHAGHSHGGSDDDDATSAPAPAPTSAAAPAAEAQAVGGKIDGEGLTVKGKTMDAEQRRLAEVVLRTGQDMGANKKVLEASVSTMIQESVIRNDSSVDSKDRDSLGLFQQRPSQGWGTREQISDPKHAATKFFEQAIQNDAKKPDRSKASLAQSVQRSAHPEAYAKWDKEAEAIVADYLG